MGNEQNPVQNSDQSKNGILPIQSRDIGSCINQSWIPESIKNKQKLNKQNPELNLRKMGNERIRERKQTD